MERTWDWRPEIYILVWTLTHEIYVLGKVSQFLSGLQRELDWMISKPLSSSKNSEISNQEQKKMFINLLLRYL